MIAAGSLPSARENLAAGFAADHFVKVAHHGGIGMRAEYAAQQVMGGVHVCDPVAHGLVDGVFQGARTRVHAAYFGAQQPHAEDIQFLPPHVLGAHVNHAFESEQGARP